MWAFLHKGVSGISKLTQKQQRFVDEYIISGNATQAAIKAGYAPKAAYRTGSENLRKPQIAKAIEDRNKQIASEKIMTMKEVMQRLTAIARGETTEEQLTNKGDVVKMSAKTSDRIKAMELIGKRHAAWTDKKEVSGNLDIQIGIGDYDDDD